MTKVPLGRLKTARRTGAEQLMDGEKAVGPSLLDFWAWCVSDLVSNATRGRFAEFIVASALDINLGGSVRDEWQAFDLQMSPGVKIEVKSAAYLQSWFQKRESNISFEIKRRRGWNPDTNELQPEAKRHAQVYVFALLAHRDKTTVDPLKVDQWRFWSVSAGKLDGYKRSQHSITRKSLVELAGEAVAFTELREAVERAAGCAPASRA